ncbi:MAG TPA: hypothetical protein VKG45_00605 [Actinomycetes bacterium]|nr:hypothetical protein [Actinomycetes bacterium]
MTAAQNAAQIAYQMERLRLVDVPMMEIEKDRLAFQKAQQEVENAYRDRRYAGVDLPMVRLQQDQLVQQRGELALKGVQLASQEGLQRAQIGLDALRQQEQLGLGREQAALQGLLGAEELARGADQFALQGAGALNQTALAALGLSGQFRGPRNAWVQQQVNRGLNAAGLSSDVGAIAGEYSPAAFLAPQTAPQAAGLGTAAQDMAGAGGFTGRLSPNDLIRQAVTSRMANPYGAAGALAAGRAAEMGTDPYGLRSGVGAAGRRYALDLLANQYGSPSSYAALQLGYGNLQEGLPNAPSMRARGMGTTLDDAYRRQMAALGRPLSDQEYANLISSTTSLPPDVALRLARENTQYYRTAGAARSPEDVEKQIIDAYTRLGPQMSPGSFGAPERVDRAWYNATGGTNYLPWNDPRTLNIYRDAGGVDPFRAPDAANAAATWYRDTGYAMPGGQFGGMIANPQPRTSRIGYRRTDDPYGGGVEYTTDNPYQAPYPSGFPPGGGPVGGPPDDGGLFGARRGAPVGAF